MGWIMPQGALPPIIELHSIDDVPFLTLTLWGKGWSSDRLRPLAAELAQELSEVPEASRAQLIGGQPRVVRVEPDPDRMAAAGISWTQLTGCPAGGLRPAGRRHRRAGQPRDPGRGRAALPQLRRRSAASWSASRRAAPSTSPRWPASWTGPTRRPTPSSSPPGRPATSEGAPAGSEHAAVTIALVEADRGERDRLAESVLRKVEDLRPRLLPAEVRVDVTRNYGETAKEKSNELVDHLLIATLSVVALISLAMGWRSGLVVGIAVPVTLALTLFIYYVAGYTLNRVTLFALIFSIGILVDDAIVVVENIERHHREKKGLLLLPDGRRGDRRGRQPHHPRHLHRHRRHPAHGLRARADGAVHEPHPDRRLGGHALLAGRGLHRHPVGGGADLPPRPRGEGARRGPRGLRRPASTAG